MKPEIKEKWLTALRSGEYKQGQGELRNSNNEFCCLGVLCDLYAKETGTRWAHFNGNYTILEEDYRFLPEVIQDWAGIENRVGYFSPDSLSLTSMNDHGYSFEEIAIVIENHF